MEEEIWKDIPNYEGLYQISNLGNVKSLNYNGVKGRILLLKPGKDSGGYLHVQLYKNRKRKIFTVHRLVGMTFIPNPDNLPCINHRDERKENNCVDNLEWCSVDYNNHYGTRLKSVHEKLINYKKFSKPVRCTNLLTNESQIFPSASECDRIMGLPFRTTCARIADRNGYIKKYNLYVEYIENEEGI